MVLAYFCRKNTKIALAGNLEMVGANWADIDKLRYLCYNQSIEC